MREDILHELALVAGFFMLGFGLYLVYAPLSFIACGGLLFVFGLKAVLGGEK